MQRTNRGTSGLRLIAAGATLAGLLALAPSAEAQRAPGRDSARAEHPMRRGPGGEGRMDPAQQLDRRVAMLTERLSLTERQTTQVRQILTQQHEQMEALRRQAGFQRPAAPGGEGQRPARPSEAEREAMRARMQTMRTQMDSIHAQTDRRIEAVLTEQQRATYRELRARRQDAQGPRGPRGPRGEGRAPRGGAF